MTTGTNNIRVLIVEDEPLVAMHLEDLLIELGHLVVGVATRIRQAMPIALKGNIDLAILDVNVAGVQSFLSPRSCGNAESPSFLPLATALTG